MLPVDIEERNDTLIQDDHNFDCQLFALIAAFVKPPSMILHLSCQKINEENTLSVPKHRSMQVGRSTVSQILCTTALSQYRPGSQIEGFSNGFYVQPSSNIVELHVDTMQLFSVPYDFLAEIF